MNKSELNERTKYRTNDINNERNTHIHQLTQNTNERTN